MALPESDLYHLPENCIFLVSQKALIFKDGKVLVLKCIELDGSEGKWELPGGLKDWEEDPEACLRREVEEETGLRLTTSKLLANAPFMCKNFFLENRGTFDAEIFTSFHICGIEEGDIQLSHEHTSFMWATPDETTNLELAASAQFAIEEYLKHNSS